MNAELLINMTSLKIVLTLILAWIGVDYFREGEEASCDAEGRGGPLLVKGLCIGALCIVAIVLVWLWL